MFVIGTAGHVDHGKSTLVHVLTGIDPDRLAEEKAREMTIDLGFAWLTLPGLPDEVGVIDVPGHRDFIENMLAGVGGIDLALFVVAADEGVMPQTREHLAILDLLQIQSGVVALTKVDLIDDPDWLELVTLDLTEAFERSILAHAPIIPVSAHSGLGLDILKTTLAEQLRQVQARPDVGRPRLPVDRVFSLSGFGTVVTGTLVDGQLRLGDEVEIQPAGLTSRIRGLQTHKTKLTHAQPGSRVALNLGGLDKSQVQRGAVVARPGVVRSTVLLDVVYRHLAAAEAPLKHNSEVKLFVGSAETVARVRVLGASQLDPGAEGWLQLALREPVAAVRGDRFILRRPSPGATLGGGRVLDPHPGRRHRRFRPELLARLRTLTQGTPAELLLQAAGRLEPTSRAALLAHSGLEQAAAETAYAELLADDRLVELEGQAVTRARWQQWAAASEQWAADYHAQYPLRPGLPREELRSRLKLKANVFNPLARQLVERGLIVEDGPMLRLPEHAIRFSAEQDAAINRLHTLFQRAGINSPSVKEAQTIVGDDVYEALLSLGRLKQVNQEVVWLADDYAKFIHSVYTYLQQHGAITVAQVRDHFQTSRKYAIALLEHLDERKMTRRNGDTRELIR